MGLYKRKAEDGKPASKIWWMRGTTPDGKAFRLSTKTENKQQALAVEVKHMNDLFNEQKLGEQGNGSFLLAVEKLLDDKEGMDVHKEYNRHLEWWAEQFALELGITKKAVRLKQIDKALIIKIAKIKKDETTNSTANRHLAALRVCLRLAHRKYDMIAQVPVFFMYPEPKGRTRWITQEQIQALLLALPEHVRPQVVIALCTGLRRTVVDKLTWSQIDLERRTITIAGEKQKNDENHVIPITDMAFDVISAQVGKHPKRVWTFRGRPFARCTGHTWHRAVEKAGITDFRWHDLRHTWATMLAQKGATDGVLMMLGAWKSVSMVRKYAHHNLESVRATADFVNSTMNSASIKLVVDNTRNNAPQDQSIGRAA